MAVLTHDSELVHDLMKTLGIDKIENVIGFTLKVELNNPCELIVRTLANEKSEFDHERKYKLVKSELVEEDGKVRKTSLNRKPDKGEVESLVKEASPKLNQN